MLGPAALLSTYSGCERRVGVWAVAPACHAVMADRGMTARCAISSADADAIGPAQHQPTADQTAAMPPPASESVAAAVTFRLATIAISVLTALFWCRRFLD